MQPKTKAQIAVNALFLKAPGITPAVEKWAARNCLTHEAVKLKSGKVTCLDCGHNWQDNLAAWKLNISGDNYCPSCGIKLQKIKETRSKVFGDGAYFNVITTFSGYQIVRIYRIRGSYKVGRPVDIVIHRVGEIWMDEKGKYFPFGYYAGGTYYADQWQGKYELRNKTAVGSYNFGTYRIYPKINVLPEIKQRGFAKAFHKVKPFSFFHALLVDEKSETLLKAGQYSLFQYRIDRSTQDMFSTRFWPSIKICIRNNYTVKDAGLWCDYLDLLIFFNKDLRNAKFVCPDNLKAEHDKYVVKKRAADKKQELHERHQRMEKEQRDYEKAKAAFFGLVFTDGAITVKIIDTVQGFLEEGDTHKHCVYTNAYYKKPESLVFTAQLDGKPLETVEVSLKQMKVVHARGTGNKATPYHSDIIALVNKNMKLIKRASKMAS
jgi:PcfJ-like protein